MSGLGPERTVELAAKVERLVGEVVIPYEADPRRDSHGPAFQKPSVPDLDNTRIELANGLNPDDVRIVKASGPSLGLGCAE